ncbi:hypothetical protein DdX_21852 [Ditylenchus destructor]|uniref:Uncharacterized protein n=1 Tax=Ditylenchus destructor TaxID=166010 RepID=A0AAD4MF57_9BILA|nr:hypothetical protein DdX_21852 [Ditylenchus destructor]
MTQTNDTPAESVASQLVRDNTVDGRLDTAGLAVGVARADRSRSRSRAGVIAELETQLTPVERGQLAAALDTANDNGPDRTELIADVAQIGLDIVGIVDPTGIADISNAAISVAPRQLARRRHIGGRRARWSAMRQSSASLAAGHRPSPTRSISPRSMPVSRRGRAGLRQLADALDAAPLDMLPASARETLQGIRSKLDEVLDGSADAAARAANNLIGAGTRTGRAATTARPGLSTHRAAPPARRRRLPNSTTDPRSSAESREQSATGRAGIDGDQGGHIIGHRFLPDQGTVNMFPQAGQFNNSAYRHDGE